MLGALAVVLAVGLGAVAATLAGKAAGAVAALAGLVSPPLLSVALDRQARNRARQQRREDRLQQFGPPQSANAAEPRKAAIAESGVASYLRPENQVVSFRDRPELDQLVAWCESAEHAGVRLVTGQGGAGKTRLALQLAEKLDASRWCPLWVPPRSERDAVTAVRDIGQPCVLIVDYAETRGELAGLLDDVARDRDGPDIRVLLLARSAEEWWRGMLASMGRQAASLAGAAAPITLGPVPAARGTREIFDDALTAFSRRLGVERPDASLPALDPDPVVLVIHAAALLAVLDHATGAPQGQQATSDSEVVEGLLRHEDRYWKQSAAGRGLELDLSVLRLAVAVGCLIGAESQDSATELLTCIPDLDSGERRGQVARWLHDLYPVPRQDDAQEQEWLGLLQPDRFAEQLVTDQLAAHPDLIPRLFTGLREIRAIRALTILARAAQNEARAEGLLGRALAADLDHLAIPAVKVAVRTNPMTGELLREAISSKQVSRETLTGVAEATPYPSFALARTAALVLRRLADDSADDGKRAGWLMSLSDWLGDLGERDEALKAIEDAVAIYRPLAEADSDVYRISLAISLNSQSMRLGDLGQRKDALKAINEAVDICGQLADERPDAYRPKLADVLHTQSYRLADLGRRKAALKAINEAVGIYRPLAEADPDVYRISLAISLNSHSMRLGDLGQRKEALAPINEAVDICGQLADERPDAYRPKLADVLHTQSYRLADLGRRKDALKAINEAVGIYQPLSDERPGAFRPSLAISLNSQSDRLADIGQRKAALKAINEAVAICRSLSEKRPSVFRPSLVISLNSRSMRLGDLGQREEALAPINEAVDICRQLADELRDAFRPKLADVLHTRSSRLADLARYEEALAPINEAVGIYRQLDDEFPGVFLPGLAELLNSRSMRLGDLGQREEALTVIDEAVGICLPLADELRDAFRPKLADVLHTQSYRLADLARREEALTVIDEAVGICLPLADELRDAFRPKLADVLHTQSYRLADLARREEALTAINDAVGIYRQLDDEFPDVFRPDLAGSLNSQSMRLGDLGQPEQARAAIEEAVGIYRGLADVRPDLFSPDLATSLGDLAEVLSRLNLNAEALAIRTESAATVGSSTLAVASIYHANRALAPRLKSQSART